MGDQWVCELFRVFMLLFQWRLVTEDIWWNIEAVQFRQCKNRDKKKDVWKRCALGAREKERHKCENMEIQRLRSMCGVTRIVRPEKNRHWVDVWQNQNDKHDLKDLKLSWQVKRSCEEYIRGWAFESYLECSIRWSMKTGPKTKCNNSRFYKRIRNMWNKNFTLDVF